MSYMFASANSIDELDLSSFDTSMVSSMDWMFWRNRNLKTIYV
jgi:surface protein